MPELFSKRRYGLAVIALLLFSVLLLGALTYYQWRLGLAGLILLVLLFLYVFRTQSVFEQDIENYIQTLTHRVNKAGEEAVTKLPIGILLYNEEKEIQWANPYMRQFLPEEFLGEKITMIDENLISRIEEGNEEIYVTLNERQYVVHVKAVERLLYFFDMTDTIETKNLYEEEQAVIAIIYLDN